ncbi:hypothetical protein GGQ68_004817 [Sagittula marina]|uniref:Pectate lyase superfamily protein domain-containing protein n=1 Tax=Sagittula marina TaxID=943940 RepID=A0A7W6GUR6_9RHOB|nr:hypothetical protein [Sagittula marina]MBB3988460.1 hypothetical protein [Sagittula marina]
MGFLNLASIQAKDGLNSPIKKVELEVFIAGTDHHARLFRDSNLTDSIANPQRSDATGTFRSCYTFDGVYRLVMYSPEGEFLQSYDGIKVISDEEVEDVHVFNSVQELLSDTTLSYDIPAGANRAEAGRTVRLTYAPFIFYVSNPGPSVPPEGELGEAGNINRQTYAPFIYEIAAPDATDQHLTTAGGVKLYVYPINGFYDGRAFGARHDGISDDAPAYAAAFAAAESSALVEGVIGVFVAQGVSLWNSPVSAQLSGNHFAVRGTGRRSSVIKAGPGMAGGAMLTIGQEQGIFSRHEIEGIGFNMNYTAATALDMTFCRYSDVHHCDFYKPTTGSICMRMGRWVNRFWMNQLNGRKSGGGQAGMPLLIHSETINDMQIWGNSISNFMEPLTCEGNPHDLKIWKNTFDFMIKAAIFLKSGGRNVTVNGNYFEQCGTADAEGVPIAAQSGGTAPYSAVIVGSHDGTSSNTLIENLVVEKNQFANCHADRLGLFSGLRGLVWKSNHALRNYTYPYAVSFVEACVGQSVQFLTQVRIDQTNYNAQFAQLVQFGGSNPENDHNGMQIIERRDDVRPLTHAVRDLVPSDLTKWTLTAGSVTQSGTFEAVRPVYALTGDADMRIDIPLDAKSGWKRRYIRCNALNKGTTAVSNGVVFDVLIDRGAGMTTLASSSRSSGSSWGSSGRNMTLYIPEDTITVRFRLRQINASDTAYVTALSVDSASTDLRW